MNILVYTTLLGPGGIAHHSREFTKKLAKNNKVKVVNFNVPNNCQGYRKDMLQGSDELEEVHHKILHQQSFWNSDNELEEFPLSGYEEDFTPEVIIILAEANHYYYYRNFKELGIPVVAYFPWETSLIFEHFLDCLKTFDQIWTFSEWQKINLKKQGLSSEKIRVVPPGVDSQIYFPLTEKKHKPFTFLHIGTWEFRKSTYEIVKAFQDLFGDRTDVQLRLSINNKFREQETPVESFDRFGLVRHENIVFLGTLSEEEYIKEVREADVYLSCARGEGWNFPLLHSLASGVPSIFSKCTGQLQYTGNLTTGVDIVGEIPTTATFIINENQYKWDYGLHYPGNLQQPDFNQLTWLIKDVHANYSKYKKEALEHSNFIHNNFDWVHSIDTVNKYVQEFKVIQNTNSDLCLAVNSKSFGDTLASTPTLRYLHESYGRKLDILTYKPDVFKNSPYVNKIYSNFNNKKQILSKYSQVFETFTNSGRKDGNGVEKKFTHIDIRHLHSMDLGFQLTPNNMHYDFFPDPFGLDVELPTSYIVLHITQNWPNRTWAYENWYSLIEWLRENNIFTVTIGKGYTEIVHQSYGKKSIDKGCPSFDNLYGLDLTDQGSISDMWHVVNGATAIVTMDSGPLHLAGTTDTYIIQLGSAVYPSFRAPYRNGEQTYKYEYIGGQCSLFCNSNLKYNVKEWGHINAVPPLIGCLENKTTFECHPTVEQVINSLSEICKKTKNTPKFKKDSVYWADSRINYNFTDADGINGKVNLYDKSTGLKAYTVYHENLGLEPDSFFWISLGIDTLSTFDCILELEIEGKVIDSVVLERNNTPVYYVENKPITKELFDEEFINVDNSYLTYWEIFIDKTYEKHGIEVAPNDTVLDIGGNHGLFSIYSLYKNAAKVYTVEPSKECFASLEKLAKTFDNLHPTNSAVFSNNDYSVLISDPKHSAANHLEGVDFDINIEFKNKYTVPNIHINTLLEKIYKTDSIDLLKVDCEGSEEEIFEAVDLELLTAIPKLIVEVHSSAILGKIKSKIEKYYNIYGSEMNESISTIYCKIKR